MVTVVALDGSSYCRPGVRMLLSSNGKRTGAISGGCEEKEVQRRAQNVFEDENPKTITYDGRYHFGCEGVLHILLEPFPVSEKLKQRFEKQLELREPFTVKSYLKKGMNTTTISGRNLFLVKKNCMSTFLSRRRKTINCNNVNSN